MLSRRLAAVLTAVATFGVPAAPSAHAAATYEDYCGPTVFDYGKVALNACWRLWDDGKRVQAGFMFRIVSPTTDTLWNDCKVDFQIRDQYRLRRWVKDFDCLALAQGNRGAKVWDYLIFEGEPGRCYNNQAAWRGIYNNTSVGSHENATEYSVCTISTGAPVVLTTTLLDLPAVPGLAIVEPVA